MTIARVTSNLQVTIPKAVADRYGIAPGTEIEFEPAGDVIRVVPVRRVVRSQDERVKLFERALERQREREASGVPTDVQDRGWAREDLYGPGRTR